MKLRGGHVRGTQEKMEREMRRRYDATSLYMCVKLSKT